MTLNDLCGTWLLISYELIAPDGTITFPLGDDAEGMILYDPRGYMSVQMMRRGRRRFQSKSPFEGSASEREEAAAGYLAYCGRFALDEQRSVLIHYPLCSLYPNYIGGEQERSYRMDGEHLVLTTPAREAGGVLQISRLTWKRAA